METPACNPSPETKWFYADENRNPVGPVPFAELQDLARVGKIGPNTYVIEANVKDWKVFSSVQSSGPKLPPIPKSPRHWPVIAAAGVVTVCALASIPVNQKAKTAPHTSSSVALASVEQLEKRDVPSNRHEAAQPSPVMSESIAEGNFAEDVSSWNRGILPSNQFKGQVYMSADIESVLNDVTNEFAVYCVGDDYGREYLVAVPRDPVDEAKWAKETKGGIEGYYEGLSSMKLQGGPLYAKPKVKVMGITNLRGETGRLRAVVVVQGIK